jgi:dGTPase
LAAWTTERAPYASDPEQSRGRRVPIPESATRSPFQRDRDRIIHSTAFRRLKEKTQVFVAHEGDHYRTRLTHSLEVAQIARALARTLGLDEDLAEALALAHDLGHPPFGHAGEAALDAAMQGFGGFDHNANTLRIVTRIEARYPDYDGLNLSWETLEGVVKHNGPLLAAAARAEDLPWALLAYEGWRELELGTFAGPEAQVAAIADDIAYNNHDIDDGLRQGLFRVEEVLEAPFAGPIFAAVLKRWPDAPRARQTHEAVRDMIGAMLQDVLAETRVRAARAGPESAADVRAMDGPLVAFSDGLQRELDGLRKFLWTRMYRHPSVNRKMSLARRVVADLFRLYLAEPNIMPLEWQARAGAPGDAQTARTVCDYVAGMTDRYALEEHRALFSPKGYY